MYQNIIIKVLKIVKTVHIKRRTKSSFYIYSLYPSFLVYKFEVDTTLIFLRLPIKCYLNLDHRQLPIFVTNIPGLYERDQIGTRNYAYPWENLHTLIIPSSKYDPSSRCHRRCRYLPSPAPLRRKRGQRNCRKLNDHRPILYSGIRQRKNKRRRVADLPAPRASDCLICVSIADISREGVRSLLLMRALHRVSDTLVLLDREGNRQASSRYKL